MDSSAKSSFVVLFALLCLFCSKSSAFNITKILSDKPDFVSFNELLTQTGLANIINSRQAVTVLAVADSSLDVVSGKDLGVVRKMLSVHVVVDYYDQAKLLKLHTKSGLLPTLYQTTGIADEQQGFLNVTRTPDGFMFGSAVKGAMLSAQLMSSVFSMPNSISILQISEIIEVPQMEQTVPSSPSPPSPTPEAPTTPPIREAPSPALAPTDAGETPVFSLYDDPSIIP